MRSISFLWIGILITLTASAQQKILSAEEILQPVLAKAGKENKNVLLIFHASWCTWCRKMDTSLHDASIKNAIDKNYEIVHLTVYESPDKKVLENPGALDFLKKNDGEDKGIPYWYVLNKNGEEIAVEEEEELFCSLRDSLSGSR